MTSQQISILDEVAASLVTAAHRRDHRHDTLAGDCHPHAVEVVHLGRRALAVCHDCCTDFGFLPTRQAEVQARSHRLQTLQEATPAA